MKFQLAKIYRGSFFIGYGIAVNGELLDCQVSTEIKTEANEISKVVAVFNLTAEHAENQITIDLRKTEAETGSVAIKIMPN
ncbi:TPA: hypothetical protein I9774_000539 [Serratia marcescens]|nr:hypothetical protein [Serratia marcescens]